MKTTEQVNEIAAALAKAQGMLTNPERNRTVRVTSRKTGTSYEFSYATLDSIIALIRKPLSDNGLSFTQNFCDGENGKLRLETTLWHTSGQWIRTDIPVIVDGNEAQAFGSAMTYAKRYALTALLGIAADEDDDGNAADGNKVERKDRNGARTATPTQPKEPPPPKVPVSFWARESYAVAKFKDAGDLAEKIGMLADEAPSEKALDKVAADNHVNIQGIADPGLRDRIYERIDDRRKVLAIGRSLAA